MSVQATIQTARRHLAAGRPDTYARTIASAVCRAGSERSERTLRQTVEEDRTWSLFYRWGSNLPVAAADLPTAA